MDIEKKKKILRDLLKREEILMEAIDVLTEMGQINEDSIRDFRIKKRYKELVESGVEKGEARKIVSKEFFRTDKTIQHVLYK